jgi:ATP-dependent RNA helicase DDX46/PRP5
MISDACGAGITVRGVYVAPGQPHPRPGERKLFINIEGPSQTSVDTAKAELTRTIRELSAGEQVAPRPSSGRYTVI